MAKNIVICCDGTGNQYGKNNTNVVHLFESLVSDQNQKIYYDPGVGTSSKLLFLPFQKVSKALAMAFGLDLQKNVEDAYYFLMNNYEEGDKVFLFGFSRGAHTVRRLASMLEHVGLLHKGSDNMISFASQMYLQRKHQTPDEVAGFKKSFARNCPVHFIGVWDTVSAVSSLLPRPKLDGQFSKEVKVAYHAVAIDEKRFNFPVNLWDENSISENQKVEEVWFSGVHSDVGGYYGERGLSNFSLKWISDNAIANGLKVKESLSDQLIYDPNAKSFESFTGLWKFVPFSMYVVLIPLLILILNAIGLFLSRVWDIGLVLYIFDPMWNLVKIYWLGFLVTALLIGFFSKRIRKIPENAKVHRSVIKRMQLSDYKPKNLKKVERSVQWVD